MPPPSEAEAEVRRAQQGDRGALDAIVRRYHEDVARVLWRFVRQRADLDDLVQDTFLRALRNLKQWRSDRPFKKIGRGTGTDRFHAAFYTHRAAHAGGRNPTTATRPQAA